MGDSPPLWLGALVLVLLALPSIGRGDGFSAHGFKPDDTAWYSAIAVQTLRDSWQCRNLPGVIMWGPKGYPNGGISSMVGTPYFNKPPLAFVVHGFFLWALGAVPAAARLPSIVAAALTVWFVTLTAARLVGRTGGVVCGLVLALTLEFVRHTQAFSLDLWLALWCAAAAWGVVRAQDAAEHQRPVAKWMVLAGVMLGASLMTKPLVGLIMLPIFAAWLIWERPSRTSRWLVLCGVAATAAAIVALPWHAYVAMLAGNEFTDQYFGREIADRAAGSIANLNQDAGNPLYYLAILGGTYWPWLIACVLGAWAAVRMSAQMAKPARSLLRLGLTASLVWLVVLSVFPDKRPRYLLVAYPFMAMLAGAWVEWAAASGRFAWLVSIRRVLVAWCVPTAAVVGVVLAVADPGKPRDKQYDELLAWLNTEYGSMDRAMDSLSIGAFSGQRAAVLYLETGRWPIPTRDNAGRRICEPDPGNAVIYHTRDGLSPGKTEEVVFQSGDITVTRLRERPWEPKQVADPGE